MRVNSQTNTRYEQDSSQSWIIFGPQKWTEAIKHIYGSTKNTWLILRKSNYFYDLKLTQHGIERLITTPDSLNQRPKWNSKSIISAISSIWISNMLCSGMHLTYRILRSRFLTFNKMDRFQSGLSSFWKGLL